MKRGQFSFNYNAAFL